MENKLKSLFSWIKKNLSFLVNSAHLVEEKIIQ